MTSKVAILAPSRWADADYLFWQVFVDQALLIDVQPGWNSLAAVGPTALDRGLVLSHDGVTAVRIYMLITGEVAVARVAYRGAARMDGVPGQHGGVPLMFNEIAGSFSGALRPSRWDVDIIDAVRCTLIDNGMPVVVMPAAAFGLTSWEPFGVLEADAAVRTGIEAIGLRAGLMMNLGEVTAKSVQKMILVLPATTGGAIAPAV